MSWFEAIVLGLTQGLTEFLPISSSGHLIIVPWLFGWESPGVAFDAALHLGTLLAVLAYFWQDLRQMVRAVPTILRKRAALLRAGAPDEDDDTFFARLGLLLIIGSIPGAVAGLALESKIDDLFHPESNQDRAIVVIAILLAVFGVVLWLADRYGRENRILRSVRLPDTLVVGIAQALALMPGTSRSGVTLTAGLFRGFQRADAARFSFLLGIPLIAGAGLPVRKARSRGQELFLVIPSLTRSSCPNAIQSVRLERLRTIFVRENLLISALYEHSLPPS